MGPEKDPVLITLWDRLLVLTGSSARTLRRGGANLLPGRVILASTSIR